MQLTDQKPSSDYELKASRSKKLTLLNVLFTVFAVFISVAIIQVDGGVQVAPRRTSNYRYLSNSRHTRSHRPLLRRTIRRRQVEPPTVGSLSQNSGLRMKILGGSSDRFASNRHQPVYVSKTTTVRGPNECGTTCCLGWLRDDAGLCSKAICSPPCANNGVCQRPNKCICGSGFRGNYCQYNKYGRRVRVLQPYRRGSRHTATNKGFTTRRDNQMYSPSRGTGARANCQSTTCFNGGTCSNSGACACPEGVTGYRCEKVVVQRNSVDITRTSLTATQLATKRIQISLKICQKNCRYGHCKVTKIALCRCSAGYSGSKCDMPILNTIHKLKNSRRMIAIANRKLLLSGKKQSTILPTALVKLPRATNKFKTCYKSFGSEQCSLAFKGFMTYDACCIMGMGDGWGESCIACKPSASTERPIDVKQNKDEMVPLCGIGFRMRDGQCQDINECDRNRNICVHGRCVNSKGSYWCGCYVGYAMDASKTRCISDLSSNYHHLVALEKDKCYFSLSEDGRCVDNAPIDLTGTKATCCCSAGVAWGRNCEKCPIRGSAEARALCIPEHGLEKDVRLSLKDVLNGKKIKLTESFQDIVDIITKQDRIPTVRKINKTTKLTEDVKVTTDAKTTTTVPPNPQKTTTQIPPSPSTTTHQPTSTTSATTINVNKEELDISDTTIKLVSTTASQAHTSSIATTTETTPAATTTTQAPTRSQSSTTATATVTSYVRDEETDSEDLLPDVPLTSELHENATQDIEEGFEVESDAEELPPDLPPTSESHENVEITDDLRQLPSYRPVAVIRYFNPNERLNDKSELSTEADHDIVVDPTVVFTSPQTQSSTTTQETTTSAAPTTTTTKKATMATPTKSTAVPTTTTAPPVTTPWVDVQVIPRDVLYPMERSDDDDLKSDYANIPDVFSSLNEFGSYRDDEGENVMTDGNVGVLEIHESVGNEFYDDDDTSNYDVSKISDKKLTDKHIFNDPIQIPELIKVPNTEGGEPTFAYYEADPVNLTGDTMRQDSATHFQPFKVHSIEINEEQGDIEDICSPNPCQHNSACTSTDGLYSCKCTPGFQGETCEINTNDCVSDPCVHGVCVDQIGGFICDCDAGFNGDLCQSDVDECLTHECGEHSLCVNTVGSFHCVMMPKSCSSGFVMAEGGHTCIDVNECLNDTLCDGGRCVNDEGSYHCNCDTGYMSEDEGKSCKDLDECESVECASPAFCENLPGTYICKCPGIAQFYDMNTQTCKVDRIKLQQQLFWNRPTMPKKACYTNPMSCSSNISSNVTHAECCCSIGASWGDCDSKRLCPRVGSSDFHALCPHGRGLISDSTTFTMRDINECDAFGAKAICRNGNCQNSFGGYQCFCFRGFYYNTRTGTCDDIDECQLPRNCRGGTCENIIGSYKCTCKPGYIRKFSQYSSLCIKSFAEPQPPPTRVAPPETTAPIFRDVCYTKIVRHYMCAVELREEQSYKDCCCGLGVAWGSSCSRCPGRNSEDYMFLCSSRKNRLRIKEPIVQVSLNDVPQQPTDLGSFHEHECGLEFGCENGNCLRTVDGYTCDCYNGYKLNEETITCEDINECMALGDETLLCFGATCVNTPGSFHCDCYEGFSKSLADPTFCSSDTGTSDEDSLLLLEQIEK